LVKRRFLWPTRGEALAVLASAILFGVAFPPYPFVLPVFVCLVPLAVAVAQRADEGAPGRSAARIGFWFGILGNGINLYWIASALRLYTSLAYLGFAGALIAMAIVSTATVVTLSVVRRVTRLPLAILLPVVWVASELLLNYLSDLAFPWLPLGLSMARVPLLAQLADLSGVRGVSFWIAAINGLIADAWLLRAHRTAIVKRAAAVVVLVAAVALYGAWRLSSITLRPVAPIAVVQPNVPQQEKWQAENQNRIIGMLTEPTHEVLAQDDPSLVVWPETALPGLLPYHPEWSDSLRTLAREYHTPILFGVLDLTFPNPLDPSIYDYFNAAMLADSTGRVGAQPTYHKTYLVPVVERVPFLNPAWFGKLKYFGGLGRGGRPVPFELPFGKVGVLICYESIFPQRSRLYRTEGVSVLVNITNDAWFGRTIAPYQHDAHLALRAIENRVGIVRAANTGISSYIDPLGREHGATELFVPAARTYQAQTTDLHPLYVRVGDWVGTISVIATLALLLTSAWKLREP
jgi:apolipoprotein N-acyltransferase